MIIFFKKKLSIKNLFNLLLVDYNHVILVIIIIDNK